MIRCQQSATIEAFKLKLKRAEMFFSMKAWKVVLHVRRYQNKKLCLKQFQQCYSSMHHYW